MPKQSRAVPLAVFGLVLIGIVFGLFRYTKLSDGIYCVYTQWQRDSHNIPLLLSKAQYLNAIREADRSLNDGMDDPKQKAKVIFLRGIAYGAMGKFKEAFADYSSSTTPESGFVRYSEWYFQSWDDLNQWIAEHHDSRGYSQRAHSYIKNGQYDLAIADLNKVIELELSKKEGSYPYGIYLSLGHLYVQLGQYDQALSELNKALLSPIYRRDPMLNVNLAVVYGAKGDLRKAVVHYRIAAQYYWTSLVR